MLNFCTRLAVAANVLRNGGRVVWIGMSSSLSLSLSILSLCVCVLGFVEVNDDFVFG